jgi:hypothetical protein
LRCTFQFAETFLLNTPLHYATREPEIDRKVSLPSLVEGGGDLRFRTPTNIISGKCESVEVFGATTESRVFGNSKERKERSKVLLISNSESVEALVAT